MGRDARGADDGATARPAEQIGRVRVREEAGFPGEAVAPRPEEGGWSPQALALGVVALLVIVGALLLILWGSFHL